MTNTKLRRCHTKPLRILYLGEKIRRIGSSTLIIIFNIFDRMKIAQYIIRGKGERNIKSNKNT